MRPYENWEGLPSNWNPRKGMEDIADIVMSDEECTARDIAEVGIALTCLLIYKNRRYGDSALSPMSIFAKDLTPRQRLQVRMDDKINRIANGLGTRADDSEHAGIDLAGYLVLDIIAEWRERRDS